MKTNFNLLYISLQGGSRIHRRILAHEAFGGRSDVRRSRIGWSYGQAPAHRFRCPVSECTACVHRLPLALSSATIGGDSPPLAWNSLPLFLRRCNHQCPIAFREWRRGGGGEPLSTLHQFIAPLHRSLQHSLTSYSPLHCCIYYILVQLSLLHLSFLLHHSWLHCISFCFISWGQFPAFDHFHSGPRWKLIAQLQ